MPSVFDLLDDVRKRPQMFLGMTSEERGAQLQNLEMLLMGYGHAVARHQIEDPGKDFLKSFDHYLQKRRGWTAYSGIGAIAAIRKKARGDQDVWELFWKFVDEFKNSLSR